MTKKQDNKARRLRFEIFRYNPEDPASRPHMQTFELDETDYMSLYIALNEIRENRTPVCSSTSPAGPPPAAPAA